MKQSIFAFLAGAVITGVVFYFTCCQKNGGQPPADNSLSARDTIIKGNNYVVIRTNTSHDIVQKADQPIPAADAQAMIKAYLATSTATSPHYISFDFDEVFRYLTRIRQTVDPTNFGLRFYFGLYTAGTANPTHAAGTLSLILVATDANKVDYYTNNILPIDYGNLCPPATNCTDSTNVNQLIYKARRLP